MYGTPPNGSAPRDGKQALTFCNQAVLLDESLGSRGEEGSALMQMGEVYSNANNHAQALLQFTRALPLVLAAQDTDADPGSIFC